MLVKSYCRMLQEEHSAILSTFVKLPFVIKSFILSFFEWLLNTGFFLCNQTQNEQVNSEKQKEQSSVYC